jgi:hypothetical protein
MSAVSGSLEPALPERLRHMVNAARMGSVFQHELETLSDDELSQLFVALEAATPTFARELIQGQLEARLAKATIAGMAALRSELEKSGQSATRLNTWTVRLTWAIAVLTS